MRMLWTGLIACAAWTAFAAETPGVKDSMDALMKDAAFTAVRGFADLLIEHGRDDYGEKKSPLFAAQLNVVTRRIPAGSAEDPGVWNNHFEVAGYQPYCQNLLSDLGLLDLLRTLTRVTGDPKYDQARRDYLDYVLNHTRDPRSGYIPWGEHVGYDIVHGAIHVGDVKYWHEVKAYNVPWDQLWEINPDATRHEIETAFHNHICDEATFAFNRHAAMDGRPNAGAMGPCSLLSSAGLYMDAWCWLYKKTGDPKFLEWAGKMDALVAARRSKDTGLIPTDEDTRKEAMVYGEAAGYAPYLFIAAGILGEEGSAFRDEAIDYILAYDKYAYTPKRDDTGKPGYHDAVNTRTGEPLSLNGVRYMEPWKWTDNHQQAGMIAAAMAIGYEATGDIRLQALFDRSLAVMDIPGAVASGGPLLSCDAAGAITSLVHVAGRSRDTKYLDAAGPLVDFGLDKNRKNGFFTTGKAGCENYYCSRTGSGTLAMAVLAYALAANGQWDFIPPVRDIEGGLRF